MREVGGDRLEQPRTLGVRSAEGGETGDTQVRCRFFSLPTPILRRVPLTLYFTETLKDARHDVLCPKTPP